MADYRPASGSCARCRDALGLAATQGGDGRWYCCPACASGRSDVERRPPAVPELWLYPSPRRFLAKRAPKELRARPASQPSPRSGTPA